MIGEEHVLLEAEEEEVADGGRREVEERAEDAGVDDGREVLCKDALVAEGELVAGVGGVLSGLEHVRASVDGEESEQFDLKGRRRE